MSATKQDLLAQAEKIKKQIDSGKISGKATLKKAKYKMYNLRYRAGQISKKSKAASEPKAKEVKAVKTKKVKASKLANPDQGILPGFLSQMNMVRIEELVAEKVFSAIKTGSMVVKFDDVSEIIQPDQFAPVFSDKKKKAV
jgi:hypothetical protein